MEKELPKKITVSKELLPNTFILQLKDSVEVIRISPDGFFYKGEKVEDVKNIYERFNDFLKMNEDRIRTEAVEEERKRIADIIATERGAYLMGVTKDKNTGDILFELLSAITNTK